jgi:5-methylcytosine-specific restriction enzyme subunit McrC
MSKLFELYVLGLLKNKYHNQILYGKKETKARYGIPDFLLISKDEKIIIDAKYKPLYVRGEYDINDIRQLSGYSRDIGFLKTLGYKSDMEKENTVVKCLIIYPDQSLKSEKLENTETEIPEFVKFFKQSVRLPVI